MSGTPSTRCGHCGAELLLPADPSALAAPCGYCQHSTQLPLELVRFRQQQAQTLRQHQAQEQAQAFEHKARKVAGGVWLFMWIGIPLVVVGSVGFILWRTLGSIPSIPSTPSRPAAQVEGEQPAERAKAPPDPKLAERVAPAVAALAQQGCKEVVRAPEVVRGRVETLATMHEGGNCLHVVAAGAAGVRVSASVVPPTSKATRGDQQGDALDLEHCPREDGPHKVELGAADGADFAFALVDCPPARERYRDDPAKNGLGLVQARMRELAAGGCGRVLLPPKTAFGAGGLTATLAPGPQCLVILAATGLPANTLTVELKTPFGDRVPAPAVATQVRLVFCPKDAGPHPITIKPATSDYYAMASMECPRGVAEKLR
ncbi:MAG: hypothetical protein HY908_09805 [Myxococcales bacterium]|nr:hypothetical protein [Myxococcales bacterium]